MSSQYKGFRQLLKKGFVYHQTGDLSKAEKIYTQILNKEPKNFDALQLKATLLYQSKKYKEALNFFNAAINLNADFAPLHKNHGNTLKKLNRLDEALFSYKRAIQLQPDSAELYNNIGKIYEELKHFDDALLNYNKAIELKSGYAEAFFNRATVLKKLENFNEALKNYDKAIELNPDNAASYNNRGVVLKELKYFNEALKNYDKAIELKSDYFTAYSNRGIVLHDLERFDEAINSFNKAIQLKDDYAEAYNFRGVALLYLARFNEACKSYDKAIQLKQNYIEAILHKSFLKLLLGNYSEGWDLYESRKYKQDLKKNYFPESKEGWLDKDYIKGKKILVYSEQGLGDTFQFCRYLPLLKKLKPKSIFFYLDSPLVSVFSNFDKDITIIEKGKKINEEIDLLYPLLSLPLLFKTRLNNIPNNFPYIIPNSSKNSYWFHKLKKNKNRKIGLVWAGSQNKNINNRSLSLKQFSSILKLPFEFHSIQKEIRASDQEELDKYKNLQQHQNDLIEFSDTAAILNQMDLIISVDTSVAHLAGALAKRVWILLNYIPDFRWMLDREDSPWYPNARLFRQPKIDDWNSVIKKIEKELKNIKF